MNPLIQAALAYLSVTEGTVQYTDNQFHHRSQLRKAITDAIAAEAENAAAANMDPIPGPVTPTGPALVNANNDHDNDGA